MNLVRLATNSPNSFGFTCSACHKFRDSRQGGYADLEGTAFQTFYCKECGDEVTTTNLQRMPESPPAERKP